MAASPDPFRYVTDHGVVHRLEAPGKYRTQMPYGNSHHAKRASRRSRRLQTEHGTAAVPQAASKTSQQAHASRLPPTPSDVTADGSRLPQQQRQLVTRASRQMSVGFPNASSRMTPAGSSLPATSWAQKSLSCSAFQAPVSSTNYQEIGECFALSSLDRRGCRG